MLDGDGRFDFNSTLKAHKRVKETALCRSAAVGLESELAQSIIPSPPQCQVNFLIRERQFFVGVVDDFTLAEHYLCV